MLSLCFAFIVYKYFGTKVQVDALVTGFSNAHQGIVCVDLSGNCIYINKAGENLFTKLVDDRDAFIKEYFQKWIIKNAANNLEHLVWDDEFLIDGEIHYFRMEEDAVYNRKKVHIGYCLVFEDCTEMMQELEVREYEATHDTLTGLYERDTFFRMAEEIIQNDPDTPRYMICTNIRNFKLVNDLFGEEMGDRMLKDQAMMLKKADYPGTLHGRIMGDRYAMLIEKKNFNPKLAAKNSSELQYLIGDSNHRLHILIGAYEITDPTESARVMYDKANMAIEYCRDDYNEFMVIYSKDMMERLIYEKEMISDFDGALKNNEFKLFLQPQIQRDGSLKGAEALVRWEHPKKGLLQPKYFIEVLEKAGLIIKLDQIMWEAACKKLAEWKAIGRTDLCLSVNISAKDFYYTDIYEIFMNLVKKYDINPQNLSLEITETVFIADVGSHLAILDKLKAKGFKIGIDDFGSGFSSLNMLKDITADILKIDMVFLQKTKNPDRRWIILDSVITMAKQLGMSVVTEGVEDEEQYLHLVQIGSDVFQGFYFDEPLPEGEFEKKYKVR